MRVEKVIASRVNEFHAMSSVNLFSSAAWCDCYDERLQRYFILDDTEKPVGGFVAFEGGKQGIKTLITPPFAPHVGLFAENNKNNPVKVNTFRKDIMDAISDFIIASKYPHYKLDFAPEWNDMQPMIWKKIHATIRYTYRIDLHQSVAEITENLDSSKRNKISKGGREGLTAHHAADFNAAWKMISENLESNSLPFHPDIIKKILQFASDPQHGLYTFTQSENKNLAVNICVHDKKIAYNLLSAIDRSVPHNQGGTFSLFHSILKAKEKGKYIFDFEGSGVPEIEEFFRSFGGALTPYFSISGGKWPWNWIVKLRR